MCVCVCVWREIVKPERLNVCAAVAPPAADSYLSSPIWSLEDRRRRHLTHPDSPARGASLRDTTTGEVREVSGGGAAEAGRRRQWD